jgi:hypothetical protein
MRKIKYNDIDKLYDVSVLTGKDDVVFEEMKKYYLCGTKKCIIPVEKSTLKKIMCSEKISFDEENGIFLFGDNRPMSISEFEECIYEHFNIEDPDEKFKLLNVCDTNGGVTIYYTGIKPVYIAEKITDKLINILHIYDVLIPYLKDLSKEIILDGKKYIIVFCPELEMYQLMNYIDEDSYIIPQKHNDEFSSIVPQKYIDIEKIIEYKISARFVYMTYEGKIFIYNCPDELEDVIHDYEEKNRLERTYFIDELNEHHFQFSKFREIISLKYKDVQQFLYCTDSVTIRTDNSVFHITTESPEYDSPLIKKLIYNIKKSKNYIQ